MDVTSGPDPAFVPAASSREPPQMTDEIERVAREHLAAAHEQAKKPLVAVDIRTGNLGKMGVAWVETSTALDALRAAIASIRKDDELRDALEQIRDLNGQNYDSDRAWALAMQLRAKVALQGWLGGALSSVAGGGG